MNRYEIAFFGAFEANASGQLAEKTNDVLRANNIELRDGFIDGIFMMIDAVVASRVAPNQSIQKLDLLLAFAENNAEKISSLLSEFCTLCDGHKTTLTFTKTEQKTASAQQIEIVSMPDRAKVQTVERDADDEIVKTVTLESDV